MTGIATTISLLTLAAAASHAAVARAQDFSAVQVQTTHLDKGL